MKLKCMILWLSFGIMSFAMTERSFAVNTTHKYKSVEALKELAENGDIQARTDLVIMYSYGIEGVRASNREVKRWIDPLEKLNAHEFFSYIYDFAKRGNSKVQVDVGEMYENGYFYKKSYFEDSRDYINLDRKEAAYWYKLAADQGNVDGLHNLARLYSSNKAETYGAKYNIDEAVKLYKLAVEKGYNKGLENYQTILTNYYIAQLKRKYTQTGFNERDIENQKRILKIEALKSPIVNYVSDSSVDSQTLTQLKEQAKQGDIQSRADLAIMYLFGFGGVKENQNEARYWGNSLITGDLRDCFLPYMCDFAKRKDDRGIYLIIGDIYRLSFFDATEAAKWYKLAAERGSEEGMLSLGYLYERGNCGIETNFDEANRYYKMAADKGNKFGKEYVEDAAWFKNFYKQQTIN